MSVMIFGGAELRYFDVRRKDEAGQFVRLHMHSMLSAPVMEQMGWSVPDGIESATLTGTLTGCERLILTPNGKELKQHGIELSCLDVGEFKAIGETDDDGNITGHYLRFVVRTQQPDAAALLEAYFQAMGYSQAQLKVRYAEQQKLDGASADDSQMALNGSEEGEPIEEHLRGPALASHKQMRSSARATREPGVN